jgi:ACS family hexuronate transporter-like MFS transporter
MTNVTVQSPTHALGWRMWVPCIGMALCSWLSFVDRITISVLAPTILADTGLNAEDFGQIATFFFVAYTLANPLWGSLLDRIGLRVGMLLAVALWTGASVSHAFVGTFFGFALARALLGLGEGATFPGGLRTAVESLPASLRARGIATAFAGGTVGAMVTPIIMVPIAANYGWQSAFYVTGLMGVTWLVIWALIARPPFLPAKEHRPSRFTFPNFFEMRLWALVFSYALPALAPGPILTFSSIYLNQGLGVAQEDMALLLLMPPAAWGVGYFVGGWAADRFATGNPRPVGMFTLLAVCSLALGFTPVFESVSIAVFLMSWACFIGGSFQMLALKVGSYSFPREQAAMMSGIASGAWSLVNAAVSPQVGRFFDQEAWGAAFWLIAVLPSIGIAIWFVLSKYQKVAIEA